MYNLSEVKEVNGNLYISPGVREVTIESFNAMLNKNGNKVIEVTFRTVDGAEGLVEQMPASDVIKEGGKKAPLEMTLVKIRHIARAIVGEEGLVELTANSEEEFIAKLNSNLCNKPYRQKFSGQEVISNGKSWDKAVIPMPSPSNPMAEPISTEPTQLKYDKNNAYDYRRKEVATLPTSGPMAAIGVPVPPHMQGK